MQVIKGIDRILLFRKLGETQEAAKLAFQTEHSRELSVDGGDSKATKDGPVIQPGTATEEWPFNSLAARGDVTRDMIWQAAQTGAKVECWAIDRGAEAADGQYPAVYAQGTITEVSETSNAEDLVELSGQFVVEGTPQSGDATLSEAQAQVVQYEFTDTTDTTVTP